MLFNLKKSIISHLQNLPGWRTERKIVVIESDDWGSIRMPSRKVFEELKKDGYRVDNDPFMKYDNLASEDDLSGFFEVLTSVKDSKGRPAIITANTIVANPDFARIEETGFLSYFMNLLQKPSGVIPLIVIVLIFGKKELHQEFFILSSTDVNI